MTDSLTLMWYKIEAQAGTQEPEYHSDWQTGTSISGQTAFQKCSTIVDADVPTMDLDQLTELMIGSIPDSARSVLVPLNQYGNVLGYIRHQTMLEMADREGGVAKLVEVHDIRAAREYAWNKCPASRCMGTYWANEDRQQLVSLDEVYNQLVQTPNA